MTSKRKLTAKLLTLLMVLVLALQCAAPAAFAEEISNPEEIRTEVQEASTPQNSEVPVKTEEAAPAEAAPSHEGTAPAETAAPSHEEAAPAEETEPSREEAAPAEAATPSHEEAAPAEETAPSSVETAPSHEETAPAEETALKQPEQEEPSQEESSPAADAAASQGNTASAENAVPAQEEAAPAEDAVSSQEEAALAEDTAPSKEVEADSQEESAPLKEETAPAADAAPYEEETASEQTEAEAAQEDSQELVGIANKAVYYYRSKNDNADITDTYVYDDDLLKGNSLNYNAELATMSLCLVDASISSTRGVYGDEGENSKSRNLRAYLEDNGFEDFKANLDYSLEPTLDTAAVACAHKKITDNGKEYTLLVIAPRSAGYKTEWGRNFSVGESGNHQGFNEAKDKVLSFTREYIQEMGLQGEIKVWVAGASRGAGIANLVGADILRDSAEALGDSVVLTPDNLYCYTFGTPHTADVNSEDYINNNNTTYAYIHNHSESDDTVGIFPPSDMGYDRYGVTAGYYDDEKKDAMLSNLEALSETLYKTFVSGGDPDSFVALDLDYSQLLENMTLSLVPASEDNYLNGMTQADFLELLESSMMAAFGDRENYATKEYQPALEHFFGYVYGKSGEFGKLFKGITGSDYGIPTAVGMYLSVTLERFVNGKGDGNPENVEKLKDAVSLLDAAINGMMEGGLELPAHIQEKYDSVKDLIDAGMLEHPGSALVNICWQLTAAFYSKAMEAGLKDLSLDDEIKELLTSEEDSMGMTKTLSYLLLVDSAQEEKTGLTQMGQQLSHLATVLGNAKSFLTPHYNEVILSWLRTRDKNYQDYKKADDAQKTGYRRVFVEQPTGVDVTGTIKNSVGEVVAVYKNGELLSTTNAWIGVTTSDGGNWIRLPIDDTYKIDFTASADTAINIKVSEYSIEDAKEVRVETSDSKYNWKNFTIRPIDSVTLVISEIEKQEDAYILDSGSAYYIDLLKRSYITYELGGGKLNGVGDAVTALYDNGTELTLPAPYRDGYRFVYWEGSRYNAGDKYTVDGDHLFKAIWEKIEDGGSPSEDTPEKGDTPGKKDDDPSGKKDNGKDSKDDPEEPKPVPSTDDEEASASRGASSGTAHRVAAVQTGDTAPTAFWILILALSLCLGAMSVSMRKKG